MLHFDDIKKLKKIIKFINYVMTEQDCILSKSPAIIFFGEKNLGQD